MLNVSIERMFVIAILALVFIVVFLKVLERV